jgi:ketosteroid isomerase-like protein
MSSLNVDLVRSIYTAWERGDYHQLEWAHAEIDYKVADGPAPGTWTGVGGMTEAFRDVLGAWEDWGVVADEYVDLPGDRVLVSFHCTGRGKASGVDIAELWVNGATLFEVGDGKITRIVQYFDRADALADLGLAPEEQRDPG